VAAIALKKSVTIDNAIARFTQAELTTAQARINTLLSHDRVEPKMRQDKDTRLIEETDHLLKQANTMVSQNRLSDEDKEDLINAIAATSEAKEQNDFILIKKYIQTLADLLYYLEEV